MNELTVVNSSLPTTIEDLSKFVLVGREKLIAVKAEIRAIEKVGLAKEVREQKLHEAQDIAEAVLDAETRIGQLMAQVQKAKGGQPFHKKFTIDTGVDSKKYKHDTDTVSDCNSNQYRAKSTPVSKKQSIPYGEIDSGVEFSKSDPASNFTYAFENNSPQKEQENSDWDDIFAEEEEKPVEPQKTKAEVIKESGFTQKQVERFQTMAAHPDLVEQAKAEARENDDIVF